MHANFSYPDLNRISSGHKAEGVTEVVTPEDTRNYFGSPVILVQTLVTALS